MGFGVHEKLKTIDDYPNWKIQVESSLRRKKTLIAPHDPTLIDEDKEPIAWDAIISSIDVSLFLIVRLVEAIKRNTPELNEVNCYGENSKRV
jgi:hypothetical protein